jgi:hypothetical protein
MFLDCPANIKSADLPNINSTAEKHPSNQNLLRTSEQVLEAKIFEALLGLMDLTIKIREIISNQISPGDRSSHFIIIVLCRKLAAWYTDLVQPLRWGSLLTQSAPSSYFLLQLVPTCYRHTVC